MAKYELIAEKRDDKGTSASRRLRRAGKFPAVIYGADREAVSLVLDHETLLKTIHHEAFHSSILTIKIGADTEQAILRDIQMHPFKPRIQHMDFQRISATEKLHMKVPLHFTGQDQAPGVKLQGGIVTHTIMEVDVSCLPKDLPEFLTIDMSELSIGQSLHLSDIKLPAGVEILALARDGEDLSVAAVLAPRVAEEEPAPAAAAEAVPAATAAAPAAAEPAKK